MSIEDRKQCLDLVKEAVTGGASQAKACQILELSQRTLQRWQLSPSQGDQRRGPLTPSAKNLTLEEKNEMIHISNSLEYRELNPHKIVVKLADFGKYVASESSFYRLLKANDLLTHRSKSRVKSKQPPKCLIAKNPNEVWSWDITFLKTEVRGMFYYLYMIEDIYSRMIVGWSVEEVESAEHSARLMERCCLQEKVSRGQIDLHADNGGPMKGATMLSTLQRLGVAPSFSRPSVSNDNPFSESLFKTLKYCPQYPTRPFTTLAEARVWVEKFVTWYNTEHLHSEIKFVTPQSRHEKKDTDILLKRDLIYKQSQLNNPLRWSGKTRNWNPVTHVVLNPGKEQKVNKQLLRDQAA